MNAVDRPSSLAYTFVVMAYGVAEREGTELQSALRDILTDARHAADHLGLDFDEAVRGSAEVFAEEQADA
jgi:hypothetical protein